MQDYELYYWGLPFRGNFVQLFLEEVRADYRKLDAREVYPDKNLNIQGKPGQTYLIRWQPVIR